MLGQLDGLSIELSRNKGRKSVKNFSDFPDVITSKWLCMNNAH